MKVIIVVLSFLALANAVSLPPLNGCGVPPCTNTTVHYPHIEQGFFWQCAPEAGCDAWKAVKMPCAPGLWFSYLEQACVRCGEWENPCGLNPPPVCECEVPTAGPTTDAPTTIEITEQPPVVPENCAPPICYKTETLFPHIDPTKFWQCVPVAGCDDWAPVEKICPPGLLFSWKHQVCVWDCDWENICNVTPPPVTQPPITTEGPPSTIEVPEFPVCDPVCTNTTVHYPHPDPNFFWQCAPEAGCDAWKPVKMPCPAGLWFSFKHQACVWCSDWENPCNLDPVPDCECVVPNPTTSAPPITTEAPPPPIEIPEGCEAPICYKTEQLFPHPDPTKFWQCAPVPGCDDWAPVVKQCPHGLFFRNSVQVCDWCNEHTCDNMLFLAPKC